MPRANRYYIPGYIWHITHRCHKKEFLLKFARDRQRWIQWLFEAKKRFGIKVLNYMVTSNHIHLLVQDREGVDIISKSVQLIAGRTGQEYNLRKNRKGAYWEDRYHATAVEKGSHLIQCLLYIDMNIVRAGVVKHPEEWPYSGYYEIQNPRQRYKVVDSNSLLDVLGIESIDDLRIFHRNLVENSMKIDNPARESKWTESIAVGSEVFVEETKEKLGIKSIGRKVIESDGAYMLRESHSPYNSNFTTGNVVYVLLGYSSLKNRGLAWSDPASRPPPSPSPFKIIINSI